MNVFAAVKKQGFLTFLVTISKVNFEAPIYGHRGDLAEFGKMRNTDFASPLYMGEK